MKPKEIVLATTDFSPAANHAVKFALKMAMAMDAQLVLLHVYDLTIIYSDVAVAINADEIQKNNEREMQSLKNSLERKADRQADIITEVKMGVFFQELNALCMQVKPYVVIMGGKGTTAAERLLFGSHAIYAMKHLKWPLLIVPSEAVYAGLKKIGLATDFIKMIDATPIDEIKKIVTQFAAQLHILNVGPHGEYDPEIVSQSVLLEERLNPVMPVYHFLAGDDIDKRLMDFADDNHLDILIVLPKHHDLFSRLFQRSHAKQLALHSRIPVLIFNSRFS